MARDPQRYYKSLGVAQDADSDVIKKSYKKLALKWHPDKNPNNLEEATEKFKAVSEAYAVLSDPNKRREYDLTGSVSSAGGSGRRAGAQANGGWGRGGGHTFHSDFTFQSANDIFNTFFGGRDPFKQLFQFDRGFDDDDDFFFGGFGGSGLGTRSSMGPRHGINHSSSVFDRMTRNHNDIFEQMGRAQTATTFSSTFGGSRDMGSMGSFSSISESTTIGPDGRRITKRTTTQTMPDGSVQTTTETHHADGSISRGSNRQLPNSRSSIHDNHNRSINGGNVSNNYSNQRRITGNRNYR